MVREGNLLWQLKSSLYIRLAALPNSNSRLAKVISKNLSSDLKQVVEVETVPSPSVQDVAAGEKVPHSHMVFVSLEVAFVVPRKRSDLRDLLSQRSPMDDADRFDALFQELCVILKGKNVQNIVGSKGGALVCWSLWDPRNSSSPKLARWVLPAPEMSAEVCHLPAHRMEAFIYNLVNILPKHQENAHRLCGGMAVFNCIESQLYEQKKAHSQLVKLLNPPDGEKEVSLASTSVKTEIQALKAVDKTLLALVDLFEEHIGCSLPARGRSWLVRFIRNLFRSRLAAVAIDSEEVERLKKNARRELGSLQRIAPILAAHIRLREPSAVAELKRVCDAAPEGPEKREMPEKLALTPTKIGHPTTHADALKKVLRHFNDAHTRLLAEVEALNKIVGREYTLRGNALFRKATGDWGLGTPFRRLRRHVRGRNGPGLAAGGASASASASRVCLVEDAAVEKRPWRYDGIAV